MISGDTANSDTQALLARSGTPCIEKPFRVQQLIDRGGENLRETMNDDLKTRLLVVDDEQSIRRLCMTIGTSLGFAVREAESAEAALSRLEAEAPDLVLTDLKLPTQSGVELLRQIKRCCRAPK